MLMGVACVLAACGAPSGTAPAPAPQPAAPRTASPSLLNDEFQIIEMGTAHGAFAIEVEAAAGADFESIARRLIDPLGVGYDEVLVYFHERGREATALPLARVQWTGRDGYVLTTY
jgi:hypothetical protein